MKIRERVILSGYSNIMIKGSCRTYLDAFSKYRCIGDGIYKHDDSFVISLSFRSIIDGKK